MTVRKILPDSETIALHAERSVTAFTCLISVNTCTAAVLFTREANRHGIIPLTFTA